MNDDNIRDAARTSVSEGVFIKDTTGRVLSATPAVTRFCNLPLDDIVGRAADEFLPARLARHVARLDGEVLRTGRPVHARLDGPAPGATLSITTSPLRDAAARTIGTVSVWRAGGTAAPLSGGCDDLLNEALNRMVQGLVVVDDDLKVVVSNRRAREILDLPSGLLAEGADFRATVRYSSERGDYGAGGAERRIASLEEALRGTELRRHIFAWPDGRTIEVREAPRREGGLAITYTDVTEQSRVEAALRLSEERHSLAMQAIRDGLWDWDIDTGKVFRSKRALEICGFGDDFSVTDDRWWITRIAPADRRLYRKALIAHLRGRTALFECEYRIRDAGGRLRWLHDRAVAVRNGAGRAVRLVGAIADVSERHELQQCLEQISQQIAGQTGQEFFDLLTRNLAEVLQVDCAYVAEVDARGGKARIVSCFGSDALFQGATFDLAGSPGADAASGRRCVYGERVRQAFPGDRHLRRLEAESYIAVPLVGPDAERAGFAAVVARSPTGDPDRHLEILRAFASRAASELKRLDVETQLRDSERRVKAIMDGAADMIVTIDAGGTIETVNRAAEKLLGYTAEELVGQPVTVLMPEPYRSEHDSYLRKYLDGGEAQFLGRGPRIVQMVRKDGEEITVDLSIDEVVLDNQVIFVGVIRDITDRLRLENTLRQSQKIEAIGTLAGGIAHDFNNLLVPIIGLTEMMLEEEAEGSSRHENLSTVMEVAERASGLVQQLLTFSRDMPPQRTRFDLAPVIRDSVKLLRMMFPASVRIDVRIDDRPAVILGDPMEIQQVVLNLAGNARGAMADKGLIGIDLHMVELDETAKTGLFELAAGRYACLETSDTGCGMDEETLSRVFEPFFTTKAVGEGTGLGLSVVHGIVKSHGGAISVASVPGEGTTFRVYFPLADPGREAAAGAAAAS